MKYVLCNVTFHQSYREKPNNVSPPAQQEINAFVNTSFPKLSVCLNVVKVENVQWGEETKNKRKELTSEQTNE